MSVNTINIPYVEGPTFRYSPTKFEYNKTLTFSCLGSITPLRPANQALNITFKLNNNAFAAINKNQLVLLNPIPGLAVTQTNNNTIAIMPKTTAHRGRFSCSFKYINDAKSTELLSGQWNANGIDALAGRILLVLLGTFAALFVNH